MKKSADREQRNAEWKRVLALCALLTAGPAALAFVYESDSEFYASGDFDGDGRQDQVIVDRATGFYRIGYQLAPDAYTWAAPRAGGVEDVEGVAVGAILVTNRDALAFAAASANRINVLDAGTPGMASNPVPVFLHPALGPNLVVAIDIAGAGNTAHDDLLVGCRLNDPPLPFSRTLVRSTGAALSTIINAAIPQRVTLGNRVRLKEGTNEVAGAMAQHGVTNTFQVHSLTSGAAIAEASAGGLTNGTRYVHGLFAAGPLHHYVFYLPGLSNLVVRAVEEPSPGSFQFGAPVTNSLTNPIHQVFALPGVTNTRLLVLVDTGQTARVYDFDGATPPALMQSFLSATGAQFTGAAVLSSNNFMLYSGDTGSGESAQARPYAHNGSSYVAGGAVALPPLTAFSAPANVFLFEDEPFVSAMPRLLARLHTPDWTSELTLPGAPKQVNLTAEMFVASGQGLDNPAPRSLGEAPVSAGFGLVNQYMEPISLYSFSPAIGDEVSDVEILPPAGLYATGIFVSFTSAVPTDVVYYRRGPTEPWSMYASPFYVFEGTTVSYYGRPFFSLNKSTIREATYEFTAGPGTLDSDGDGVPDYVELGMGLDPFGGDDSDGDGFSDKNEFVFGFDPLDDTNHPPTNAVLRLEERFAFDLVQTPRPYDGTVPGFTLVPDATGVAVRVYDMQGDLYQVTTTAVHSISGVLNPAARLSNIVINTRHRLMTAATEQHFHIQTANADTKIGRELIGFTPVPSVTSGLQVAYSYGGGDLATEASNWVAAAQTAQTSAVREMVTGELDTYDTLVGLLVEKKVGDILHGRGTTTNDVTLFPFRASSAGLYNPSQSGLLALESQLDTTNRGYRLTSLYQAIEDGVRMPADATVSNLKAVVDEIYRISSVSNNVAPGAYPSPVDVLRAFLHGGVLHSNYLAVTSLSAGELDGASAGCSNLLAAVLPRPTTNVTLAVRVGSFTDECSTLETTNGLQLVSLFFSNGQAYNFPQFFDLPPGSEVRVFAYTDRSFTGCGGIPLEVISISLSALPTVAVADSDGDSLPDAWEYLFLGGLGWGASDNPDGDADDNLTEYQNGTDPLDAMSPPIIPGALYRFR